MFECDYIRVPRPFIRKFNLNTAVMLSEIYSEYTYWKDREGLQQGGWFFSTVENMAYNTGLSKHQQLCACKELLECGVGGIALSGSIIGAEDTVREMTEMVNLVLKKEK